MTLIEWDHFDRNSYTLALTKWYYIVKYMLTTVVHNFTEVKIFDKFLMDKYIACQFLTEWLARHTAAIY